MVDPIEIYDLVNDSTNPNEMTEQMIINCLLSQHIALRELGHQEGCQCKACKLAAPLLNNFFTN